MPKRKDYLSWEEYFISIAQVCALRSKDPNTQVGAVIVNPLNNEIVGMGYNGLPRGLSDDDYPWVREGEWKDTKYPYVIHDTPNAIINAKQDLNGFHLYTNQFPCNECAKLLIQSGIKKIFYSNDKHSKEKEIIAAKKMFNDAGVKYSLVFPSVVVIKR